MEREIKFRGYDAESREWRYGHYFHKTDTILCIASDEERRKNVERAFLVKENVVKYKKILLVDDIYTSGATMEACTRILLSAGIPNVFVLSICIGMARD